MVQLTQNAETQTDLEKVTEKQAAPDVRMGISATFSASNFDVTERKSLEELKILEEKETAVLKVEEEMPEEVIKEDKSTWTIAIET